MKVVRVAGSGKNQLEIALKNLAGKVGKVGWLGTSKYPKTNTPVAYVAAIQEFGSPQRGIPARPFMRPTIISKKAEWAAIADRYVKSILKNKSNIADAMEGIGQKAAGDIRKTISLVIEPPLKPATIKARQNKKADRKTVGLLTKPLMDTFEMYGSLINTVEDE